MSAVGQVVQQLQKDLQNELTTANQLLRLISIELQQIRHFTGPGGEFEENLKQNTYLTAELAKLENVSFDNLPTILTRQTTTDQILANGQHYDTPANNLNMDDTQ